MSGIELERSEHGVWTLLLNRPERGNALDRPMCHALSNVVMAARLAPDARALVVGGVGPAFCAGAHLGAVLGDVDRSLLDHRRQLHEVHDSLLGIRRLPIPTIAAVRGAAVGAGLHLALACDIRIAGPDASFAAISTRMGLHPGGRLSTSLLVQVLGAQRALALLLDGGSLDGDQAVRWGLALEQAEDPLTRAEAMASGYAGLEPELVVDIKRAVSLAAGGNTEFVARHRRGTQR